MEPLSNIAPQPRLQNPTVDWRSQSAFPMMTEKDGLFLLFFRSVYLSMAFGFTAFTFLGFARLGTTMGLIATVIVALGSEVSFTYTREEEEMAWKDERHLV